MRIVFFSCQKYDIESIKNAQASDPSSKLEFTFHSTRLDSHTALLAKGYDAVVVFVHDIANKEVLTMLHEMGVQLLALRCAGYDNVDVEAAKSLGLHVVNVPNYSPYAVAEHAIALIMCLNRHIHRAYTRTRDFNFMLNGLLGFEMHGKTIGVIGTGRIGLNFAKLCLGFGCNVIAYDLKINNDALSAGIQYVSKDELFERSDIISLHCPLLEHTYHMINTNAVDKMKQGVILVNTSRGGLVDAKAILSGIKSKKIGGLALDVYEGERGLFYRDLSGSLVTDDTFVRIVSFPNVIVTGHQAYFTTEALDAISATTLHNISSFFEKKVTQNVVAE